MRAIPVNLNNTLVSLSSSLVSLNSTQVCLQLSFTVLLELGIPGVHGSYVSQIMQAMRAILVSLHKTSISLKSGAQV